MSVAIKHINNPLPLASGKVKGLPHEIDLLLGKALAKNPEDRFATMNDFFCALERLSQGAQINVTLIDKQDNKKQDTEEVKISKEGPKKPPQPWPVAIAATIILMSIFAVTQIFPKPQAAPVESNENAKSLAAEEKALDGDIDVTFLVNGGLGDKSFVDSAHRGLTQASEEFGFNYAVTETTGDPANYELPFINLVDDPGVDFIIVNSYEISEILRESALEHPEKYFVAFDVYIDFKGDCSGCDNIYTVQYKQNEGSYLVGLYAGLMSETGIIGVVGGMDIPIIQDFLVGYIQGAGDAGIPEENVLIQFSDSWNDPAKGKELALAMYAQGSDYVFQIAGRTGLGVFQAAEEAGKWAIGCDSDQALILEEADPNMAARIPTSMLKNVDKSLYRAMKLYFEDALPWGTNEPLGIPDGVGLAYNKYYYEYTPQDIQDKIEEAIDLITSGKIKIETVF